MEEDIKILESFIKQLEEYEDEQELKKAIENLIARNKELEEELKRQINAREITEKYIDERFIEKSKVREKIEEYRKLDEENIKNKDNMEYEECFNKAVLYTRIIWLLQELLQEGDK